METDKSNHYPIYVEEFFCQICKIKVPLDYKHIHNESLKHLIFMKILDDSLKRMKNYFDDEEEYQVFDDTKTRTESVYFCDVCTKLIDTEDEGEHEKSDVHKTNATQIKLLENFSKILLDDLKLNDVEINSAVYKEVINRGYNKTQQKTIFAEYFDDMFEYATDIEDYLDMVDDVEMKLMNNGRCMNYIDDHYVEIISKCGEDITIPIDHFTGYDLSANGELKCNLCVDLFGNPFKISNGEKLKHLYSKMHLQRTRQPIVNKNCIRELNDSFFHCGLCNTIFFGDAENHFKYNFHHGVVIENYHVTGRIQNKNPIVLTNFPVKRQIETPNVIVTKSKKNKMKKGVVNKILCTVCNKHVDEKGMKGHQTGKRHKKKLNKLGISPSMVTTEEKKVKVKKIVDINDRSMIEKNKEGIFNGPVLCKVCNIKVPGHESNIIAHLRGKKHNGNL